VARSLDSDIIANVQGDEPLIDPAVIDAAIVPLAEDSSIPMGTVCCPIEETAELVNPNIVKVVLDRRGFALYFSRLPIPFVRDRHVNTTRYRHLGLYVYRRDFLLSLAGLAPTPLEQAERLEQLRVLEHGHRLRVVIVRHASPGVDTPEDLERLRAEGPQRAGLP
jgi:3-deoxy-manno-octulosonate cytidylyltransferase (CMP-KDO synthetase)